MPGWGEVDWWRSKEVVNSADQSLDFQVGESDDAGGALGREAGCCWKNDGGVRKRQAG